MAFFVSNNRKFVRPLINTVAFAVINETDEIALTGTIHGYNSRLMVHMPAALGTNLIAAYLRTYFYTL